VTPPLPALEPYLGAVRVDLARTDKVVTERMQKGEGEGNTDEILDADASRLIHPHEAIHPDPLPPSPSQFPTPGPPQLRTKLPPPPHPRPGPTTNQVLIRWLHPIIHRYLICSSMAVHPIADNPFVSGSQEAQVR
jgi:hypothetical protein